MIWQHCKIPPGLEVLLGGPSTVDKSGRLWFCRKFLQVSPSSTTSEEYNVEYNALNVSLIALGSVDNLPLLFRIESIFALDSVSFSFNASRQLVLNGVIVLFSFMNEHQLWISTNHCIIFSAPTISGRLLQRKHESVGVLIPVLSIQVQ